MNRKERILFINKRIEENEKEKESLDAANKQRSGR